MDNIGKLTFKIFNDYCTSVGIDIQHSVPHVHTKNGLAKSLIKRLQIIARILLVRIKLLISTYDYAILYATTLVHLRSTAYHQYSPTQFVLGQQPDISHQLIFCCIVSITTLTRKYGT